MEIDIEISPLDQLKELCARAQTIGQEISEAEKQIKEKKKEFVTLTEQLLPDLMDQLGVEEIKTTEGVIKKKVDFLAYLVSHNKEEALRWVINNGGAGIVKQEFVVQTSPENTEACNRLAEQLAELQVPFDIKSSAHWKSLMSFCRERKEQGVVIPEELITTEDKPVVVFNPTKH